MALESLSDARVAEQAMGCMRGITQDFDNLSRQMAQSFASKKKWIDENRSAVEKVFEVAALEDYDARIAAVDVAIDKLYSDGLQTQPRANVAAGI